MGNIEIKNPIVGGIILVILLFLLWFVFGPFGGIYGKSITQYLISIILSIIAIIWYVKGIKK